MIVKLEVRDSNEAVSASELENGEWVIAFLGAGHTPKQRLRFVTADGLFTIDGFFSQSRNSVLPLYNRLAKGSTVVFESGV